MPKKILLLSHAFPPYAFPESYLIAKQLGSFNDYQIDVITIRPFLSWVKEDAEFQDYSHDLFSKVHRLVPPSWYRSLPFSKLSALFNIPDSYVYLLPLYLKKLNQISLAEYDILISWSMYHSIHLLGPLLKKRSPNLCWISHFSDPWADNPFFEQSRIQKFINNKLEEWVLRKNDAAIFTSSSTLKAFKNKYPSLSTKLHYIPHNFVEKLYPKRTKTNKVFTIRYIGSFYQSRSPKSLIAAIRAICKTTPSFFESRNIRIEFIGNSEFNASDLFKNTPSGLITQKPPVSYLKSLELMKESDLLIVIDAPFENSPFLPSKVVDYFGAKRPIFGICASGITQSLLKSAKFLTAHPGNIAEIAREFKKSISSSFDENHIKYQKQRILFSQKKTQMSLLKIIKKLTQHPS